jgi:uncharacterized membrane protein YjjB (DUF3815 family)
MGQYYTHTRVNITYTHSWVNITRIHGSILHTYMGQYYTHTWVNITHIHGSILHTYMGQYYTHTTLQIHIYVLYKVIVPLTPGANPTTFGFTTTTPCSTREGF